MANSGRDRNGSQFWLTVDEAHHLDGNCVAFGRVVTGLDVLRQIHDTYSIFGRPATEIKIATSGVCE